MTDKTYVGPPIQQDNYKSATEPPHRQLVEQQILQEIRNGRYLPAQSKPALISALGAIPKPGSNQVRLINDCSRPRGNALNDLASNDPFCYQSVQDAVALITPSSFIAKCDLESAYRYVKVHPDDWTVSGISWQLSGETFERHYIDTRLCFGARKGPFIFSQLSQAVCRIMASQGFPKVICYLDDFLVVEDTYDACRASLDHLRKLLRTLGFAINYKKLVTPCKVLTFLGIEIDVNKMTLRLPEDKLRAFLEEVTKVYNAKNVSKRSLQSLCGRLAWAAQVVAGARCYVRRLLDHINRLQGPTHRTRITKDIKLDLAWWITFARTFNGSVPMLDPRKCLSVSLDACSYGAGGVFGDQFYHLPWSSWEGTSDLHINYKEVLALEPALTIWAPQWANHRVYLHIDNQTACHIIRRGTSRDRRVMQALRRCFWLAALYNISLIPIKIRGCDNGPADSASRLPESAAWKALVAAAPFAPTAHHGLVPRFPPERGISFSVPLLGPEHEIFLRNSQEIVSRLLQPAWADSSTCVTGHPLLLCSLPGTQAEACVDQAVYEHCPDRPGHPFGDPVVKNKSVSDPYFEFAAATDSRPCPLPITGRFHGPAILSGIPHGWASPCIPYARPVATSDLLSFSGPLQENPARGVRHLPVGGPQFSPRRSHLGLPSRGPGGCH